MSSKRPPALARADRDEGPISLTSLERKVLNEALRRGEDLREEVQSKTLEYGRWLLEAVFENDAQAALDDRSENAVWRELMRRAGGPTLGITRHMLYVAVRIAANDKRITVQAWRGLDVGRKELLLPLGEEELLRTAAKHVSDLNLSQPKARDYVTALLEANGKNRRVRMTPLSFASRLRKIRGGLSGMMLMRRVRTMRAESDPETRTVVVDELEALRDAVTEVLRAMRGK